MGQMDTFSLIGLSGVERGVVGFFFGGGGVNNKEWQQPTDGVRSDGGLSVNCDFRLTTTSTRNRMTYNVSVIVIVVCVTSATRTV